MSQYVDFAHLIGVLSWRNQVLLPTAILACWVLFSLSQKKFTATRLLGLLLVLIAWWVILTAQYFMSHPNASP